MLSIERLNWHDPYLIEDIREKRGNIPNKSGVYIFTSYAEKINRNSGVLYIGKSKNLRRRLSGYLASPFETLLISPRKKDGTISRSLRHVGKNLLLMEIQQKSRNGKSGVWLRWLITDNPAEIEKELILYYEPSFNVSMNPRLKQ